MYWFHSLLLGYMLIFLTLNVASPLTILILAVIFKSIIGTNWRDSFVASVINYCWILIFSIFAVVATLFAGDASGFTVAFFMILIGTPVTLIILNWTGNRKFPYSLFDKILYKLKGNKSKNKRKRKKRRNKGVSRKSKKNSGFKHNKKRKVKK